MDLLPTALRAQLPPLYAQERTPDPIVYLRLFTPDAAWTWLATEFDGEDTCFGLVLGQATEWGYVSLRELERVRGPLGLPVERDLFFQPQPLSCAVREGVGP